MKKWSVALICFIQAVIGKAQNTIDSSRNWTNHFQFTAIAQSHLSFKSKYSGDKSLADTAETGATTTTATLFLGHTLWKGAAIYFNPEVSGYVFAIRGHTEFKLCLLLQFLCC